MLKFDKSSNPMFKDELLDKEYALSASGSDAIDHTLTQMTTKGAVNKTILLTLLLLLVTLYSFTNPNNLFIYIGALGGGALFLFTSFKPNLAPMTAPAYAILKGLFVGTVSYVYAMKAGGIIFQAVSLTIATLLAMLMVYQSGIIKVTKSFRTGVTMAVAAVMIVYLISWVGHFVGFTVPYIHEGGAIGIGITVVIIGIAALNLLLDFDNFEKGEQARLPKHFEWYYAMGLLFTLVWLYIEFLRLLSKLNSD